MQRAARHDTPRGLFVCDLDGTLLDRTGHCDQRDLAALRGLAAAGVVRVAATGRSLFSFRRACLPHDALDYLVFSSGAAVMRLADETILERHELPSALCANTIDWLSERGFDLMVHPPVPDEHRIAYRRAGQLENADFERRLALYRDSVRPLTDADCQTAATQLLVISPQAVGDAHFDQIAAHFDNAPISSDSRAWRAPILNIVRTTSPLDHRSVWTEIFPSAVSKGLALEWLRAELQISPQRCAAVGNDTNDLSLLRWSPLAYVTADAPSAMRREFEPLPCGPPTAVALAIERFMGQLLC
jgi:hydroxymethylpyrimidine pyrophosphatase-like HAD family hydrolase